MFDYHIHTVISFDAHASMEECAQAALEKGLSEICFTEHYDEDYPYADVEAGCDFDAYRREIAKARAAAPRLSIKAGIEAALMPNVLDEVEAFVRSYPFDFVIASQHVVDGKDPWYGDYFSDKGVQEGQALYLREIYDNITRYDEFDVVGHIGYVDKYLKTQPVKLENAVPFEYKDYPELLDGILRSVIERGKGIEVNTSNYTVYDWPTPHPSILRRYAQLGGEIVTVGSDAHRAEEVGRHIADAYVLMRECGLKYVCTFDQRKPVFHTL